MLNEMQSALLELRQKKPTVLCLTNYVTMDFMANSLLALGAAPVMSCDIRETKELIKISHAVNLNIGTLDSQFIYHCEMAAKIASDHKKPVILDPVGVGASTIRTESAKKLMAFSEIIRGNASEVMGILEEQHKTQGVESINKTQDGAKFAHQLAKNLKCIVVMSGQEDIITNGQDHDTLTFGSPLMPLVTGMGCTLTAVISAFKAVISDSFNAAKLATAYFGLCGNLAEKKAGAPGVFRSHFIDELYHADFEAMRQLLC